MRIANAENRAAVASGDHIMQVKRNPRTGVGLSFRPTHLLGRHGSAGATTHPTWAPCIFTHCEVAYPDMKCKGIGEAAAIRTADRGLPPTASSRRVEGVNEFLEVVVNDFIFLKSPRRRKGDLFTTGAFAREVEQLLVTGVVATVGTNDLHRSGVHQCVLWNPSAGRGREQGKGWVGRHEA